MDKMSVEEIIENIKQEKIFSAFLTDSSFSISIEKYVPYICTAIHNGDNFSEKLKNKINLTPFERWQEEDPFTGEFIEALPIKIICNDSRYEYDLNREEESAIYEEAWGKKVWQTPLSPKDKAISLKKYRTFYKILHALIEKIETLFGAAIVYDIHSYNYKRKDQFDDLPLFNIGTERLNRKKYSLYVDNFMNHLKKIEFKNFNNKVSENEVFYGRGYLLKFIIDNFENTLVLATEIKKIYCDENSGEIYPLVIQKLKKGLKTAILNNSNFYIKNETNTRYTHKFGLLHDELDDSVKHIDRKLYSLLKEFEILPYVNPKNIEHEKKNFFDSKLTKIPNFKYKPLNLDLYTLKKELYMLPIDEINDISLQLLYQDIIKEYEKKIDLIFSRGSENFKYNSLILYGRPNEIDIKNASYIIHTSDKIDEIDTNYLSETEVLKYFHEKISEYNFQCKVEFSKSMTARAMVINSKKTLKLKKGTLFNKNDLDLLVDHEIGIHMLTTMNANSQPLRFLNLGTPNNMETQEGIAILAEFLSGKMQISRLKDLAFRVIAVNLMLKDYSFKEVFEYFMDEHNFDKDKAFYLTSRVFRGGGFTKDHLYLKGFKKIYDFYQNGKDMDLLLIGKTSYDYFELFKEMTQRGYINKLSYKNDIFANKNDKIDILDYLIASLH